MPSGQKRMVHNTRERLVSTDHNREQAFLGAHIAEFVRWMGDALSSEDAAGGVATVGSVTVDPLRAVVVNGIQARPEIGTVNLFVEPGVVGVVNPDGSPSVDDSPFKLLVDPGVTVAGSLTLTAGGGGSTRIDIVECQRISSTLEQDNRDIFNPATGLFAPSLVDKVVTDKLTYRIRLGTPGGGFPGTAAGWLPLMVASVPTTATTWNDVKCWDVRPLMQDYVDGPFNVAATFPHHRRQIAAAVGVGAGEDPRTLKGIIEAQYLGRKLGGNLAPQLGSPGTINLLDATNVIEPGFGAVAGQPWYVYLLTPFGLPRWAEYTPSSSGVRSPRSPRGIPVFTQKAPAGISGKPGSAVSIPTALGLGGNTTDGVMAIAGCYDISGNWRDCVVVGEWTHHNGGISLSPVAGAGTSVVTYNLVGNTTIPANALAVRLRFATTLSGVAATDYTIDRIVDVYDAAGAAGNVIMSPRKSGGITIPTGGAIADRFEVDVYLDANLPAGTAKTHSVQLTLVIAGGAAPTFTLQTCFIIGWKLAA